MEPEEDTQMDDDYRPIIDYPTEHFTMPTYQITITTGIGDDGEEGIYFAEAGTPPAIWARLGILDMVKDMILTDDDEGDHA